MKKKHFFLVLVVMLSGAFISTNAQTTQSTNAITPGSYVGTSNNLDVEFKRYNIHGGIISPNNSFFGLNTGTADIDASYVANSAFGRDALSAFVPMQSLVIRSNSAFGASALRNNIASFNSAFGVAALQNNTTGKHNVAMGYRALLRGHFGDYNLGIGTQALEYNDTGDHNIGLGYLAVRLNVSGSGNVGIGYAALVSSKGSNNVAIGKEAGVSLKTGTGNTFIGLSAGRYTNTGSNNLLIGSNMTFAHTASTTTSAGHDTNNSILIGSNGYHRILIDGNSSLNPNLSGFTGIGLGNNVIPNNRLELGNGVAGTSGLRFRNYNINSPAIDSNDRVLTLNASGDVILAKTAAVSGGSNDNIYNSDGAITTIPSNANNPNPGLRTVNMGNNNLFFNTNGSNFVDGTQGSGRIYIGNTLDLPNLTTPDSQYRLLVEGGILTEKVKVAIQGSFNWADYVFDDDYKLMSLNDVENFIKTNKHLPGVTSAEELVKSGLDLGEMQAMQMEKIEELTLYVIEQDKKVQQQSKEIQELKTLVINLLNKSN